MPTYGLARATPLPSVEVGLVDGDVLAGGPVRSGSITIRDQVPPVEPVSVDEERVRLAASEARMDAARADLERSQLIQPGAFIQDVQTISGPTYDGLDRGSAAQLPPAPPEIQSVEYEIEEDDYYGLVQNVRVTTTTTGTTTGTLSFAAETWATQVAMRIMQDRVFRQWVTSGSGSTNCLTSEWAITNSATTTNSYIIDQCTAAANAVWRSAGWQQCNHTKVRWTPSVVAQETPEQRVERAAREELARQARERDAAQRRVFMDTAKSRARKLLLSMLNPMQQKQLDEKNYFDLTVFSKDGSQRVYRIEHGYAGNVKLLGADGQPVKRYCIHADSRLPNEDQMLAQKLLLEANEEDFLRIANMTQLRAA